MVNYQEIMNSQYTGSALVIYRDNNKAFFRKAVAKKFLDEIGLNISQEEYLAGDYMPFIDVDSMKAYINCIENVIETREEKSCVTAHTLLSCCHNEEIIYLKSEISIMDEDEGGYYLFVRTRNITNEIRFNVALTESEQKFKNITEQNNIYYWEYTVATREMRPCFRCMRDLGLPALVKNYPEPAIEAGIFQPDYADMYRDWHRKISAGVEELEADMPLTNNKVMFHVKYTTEFDNEGNPIMAHGSATQINDKTITEFETNQSIIEKLAEKFSCILLANLEQNSIKIIKYKSILKNSADLKNGRYTDVINDIIDKISEEYREDSRVFANIEYVKNNILKDSDKREFIFNLKDESIWVRITYHSIRRNKETGLTEYAIVTCSKIDDLRAAKIVADKKIEEQNKGLEKAVNLANEANLAKTRFFANISHDIRTPMNAIMGFASLGSDNYDNPEKVKECLYKIISSGNHLLRLINDILDMSRIESGMVELSVEPANIVDICREAYDILDNQMQTKHIKFNLEYLNITNEKLICDKLRLSQILINLLSNAYKFTPEFGQVDFIVEQKGITEGKADYEIRVKDSGIGMSEEFAKHIWEAYTREKNQYVHNTQGTGLGMSIVKNIVNLMDGNISVKTKSGKGTEFVINISFDITDEEIIKETIKMETLDNDDLKVKLSKTILLVEDIDMNRLLVNEILKDEGYTIIEATNGQEALDILRRENVHKYDVILMDIMMPVMDGYQAAREIRKLSDESVAKLPIIAMTASNFSDDIKDAMDAGMDDYVGKPFDKDELISKINKYAIK